MEGGLLAGLDDWIEASCLEGIVSRKWPRQIWPAIKSLFFKRHDPLNNPLRRPAIFLAKPWHWRDNTAP